MISPYTTFDNSSVPFLKNHLLISAVYMSAAKTRHTTVAVGHIHTGAMVVNRVNEIAAHISAASTSTMAMNLRTP